MNFLYDDCTPYFCGGNGVAVRSELLTISDPAEVLKNEVAKMLSASATVSRIAKEIRKDDPRFMWRFKALTDIIDKADRAEALAGELNGILEGER
jgi:hypothetical protein